MLTIELDSVKKWRNKHEFYTIPRATCLEHSKVGNSPLLSSLCKDLVDAGHDPEQLVYIMRRKTLCFVPRTLQDWADNKVLSGDQPKQLRKKQK